MTPLLTNSRTAVAVGLVAVALSSLYAWRTLAAFDYDPTVFIAFGEEELPSREYAEERLGDVYLRSEAGHDGKFFFILANDPFLMEPEVTGAALDRPLYRSQRMLYPLLAGAGGLLSPAAITWTMLIVNLIAMGVGSWAVATVAIEMGGSPWWGLAFVLNLGFISEMNISGAGIVSAAAAFGAISLLLRGRRLTAVLLLMIAALSREAMLIAAAGSGFWLWQRRERREAIATAGVPLVAVGIWALYARARLGWSAGVSEVKEIGIPFGGFVGALDDWMSDSLGLAVGLAMMILFVLYSRRVLLLRPLVGVAFAGFVFLGIVFTERVWRSYFDITRAVAPLITAFVLMAFLSRREAIAGERGEKEFAV